MKADFFSRLLESQFLLGLQSNFSFLYVNIMSVHNLHILRQLLKSNGYLEVVSTNVERW